MRKFTRSRKLLVSGLMVVAALAIIIGAIQFGMASAAQPFVAHPIQKNRLPFHNLGALGSNNTMNFPCQSFNAPTRCYGPKQIRAAYGVQTLLDTGITGKGTTIVLVDAYQSPTIKHDLSMFNTIFNLQSAPLNIIAPDGLPTFDPKDPDQIGWAGEITLDVEWAHAMAPAATIDLVLAKSSQDADILSATTYAVNHNLGDVLSQSFGEAESCADPKLLKAEHKVFQDASKKGTTLFASSGDQGAAQASCDGTTYMLGTSTPASDPLVTAVGGTTLNANPTSGKYVGETAWNDEFGGSGGGFSAVYKRPTFQKGVPNTNPTWRGIPDVSIDGDANTGFLTVWSSSGFGTNLVFTFGGTSAGSPQWAALIALANQVAGKRLGNINAALYALGQSPTGSLFFHDITSGTNTFKAADAQGKALVIPGYSTHPGWDAVTGWGTPNIDSLIMTQFTGSSLIKTHVAKTH